MIQSPQPLQWAASGGCRTARHKCRFLGKPVQVLCPGLRPGLCLRHAQRPPHCLSRASHEGRSAMPLYPSTASMPQDHQTPHQCLSAPTELSSAPSATGTFSRGLRCNSASQTAPFAGHHHRQGPPKRHRDLLPPSQRGRRWRKGASAKKIQRFKRLESPLCKGHDAFIGQRALWHCQRSPKGRGGQSASGPSLLGLCFVTRVSLIKCHAFLSLSCQMYAGLSCA